MPTLTRRHALTLSPVAAPLLAACAPGQPTDGPAGQSHQPVQLTYLHHWGPTAAHGPITDTLVARWNRENPTTSVTGTAPIPEARCNPNPVPSHHEPRYPLPVVRAAG
jgi:hypothetical protein